VHLSGPLAAIGGCAIGGCAIGGCAIGGCAIGGCPIGIGGCPIGGCAIGGCDIGCPIGGCAIGGCAIGGCAMGCPIGATFAEVGRPTPGGGPTGAVLGTPGSPVGALPASAIMVFIMPTPSPSLGEISAPHPRQNL
tara:strand:- start:114117 stop:114524 length:408 start_codon:yes stop_codon:yes gene_type:complete